jgi:hypothetical protein
VIFGLISLPAITAVGRQAAAEAAGAVSNRRCVRSIVACVVVVGVLQVRAVERAVAPPSVEMDAALDAERHGPRRDGRRGRREEEGARTYFGVDTGLSISLHHVSCLSR